MFKKVVIYSDCNRTCLDHCGCNIIWFSKNKKITVNGKSVGTCIQLRRGSRINVKRDFQRVVFTLTVPLNGYILAREYLQKNRGIDFSKYEATVKSQLNFIPIDIIQDSSINWRNIFRKQLPEMIMKELRRVREEVEELKKDIFLENNIEFDCYSLYSAEVNIDIISPLGYELFTKPYIKRSIEKYSTENYIGDFTETSGERKFCNRVNVSLEEGNDMGRAGLRGRLYSMAEFKFYVKEKMKEKPESNVYKLLNRFEVSLTGSDKIKNIIKNNSFTELSALKMFIEKLYNDWFFFIYKTLNIAYEHDTEDIDKILKTYIAEIHPQQSYKMIHDLFVIGKLNINDYKNKNSIYAMEKLGILYKPDISKLGKKFYALNPDFRSKKINEIKGNQHGR